MRGTHRKLLKVSWVKGGYEQTEEKERYMEMAEFSL